MRVHQFPHCPLLAMHICFVYCVITCSFDTAPNEWLLLIPNFVRYNNKTYKIDDIAWEEHPTDSFEKKDGTSVTFKEYYEKTHDQPVTDEKQPLLISNPTKRDIRRGMTTPIKLLPEFCVITGLSDEIRQNFQIMKELAVHTRMGPQPRAQELSKFMVELNKNPDAAKQLTDWNLEFENNIMPIEARNFPPEGLFQKDKQVIFVWFLHCH